MIDDLCIFDIKTPQKSLVRVVQAAVRSFVSILRASNEIAIDMLASKSMSCICAEPAEKVVVMQPAACV